MSENCKHCGCVLAADTQVCPFCGKTPNDPVKRKLKWWMVVVPAVLVAAILVAVLWQPILLAVAPKAALSAAAVKTRKALGTYLDEGPAHLLTDSVDFTKSNTIDLSLILENPAAERLQADLSIVTDPAAKASQVGAALRLPGMKEFDVNLYADTQGTALSSSIFRNGEYLGVRYESFLEDLKKGALADMVDTASLEELDQLLKKLPEMLSDETDYQELTTPYAQIISNFISGLPFAKTTGTICLDGADTKCTILSYSMTHTDILKLSEEIIATLKEDQMVLKLYQQLAETNGLTRSLAEELDASQKHLEETFANTTVDLTVSSYLNSGYVVANVLSGTVTAAEEVSAFTVTLNYGKTPGKSPISFEAAATAQGEEMVIRLDSAVEKTGTSYRHTLSLTASVPESERTDIRCVIDWNRETGVLKLDLENQTGETLDYTCNLKEDKDGFILQLGYSGDLTGMGQTLDLDITMHCRQTGSVTKPTYLTPDLWTEEMLQELMEAINSLGQAA